MEIHEDAVQLGWPGDEGLGELLIDRLVAGSLTVLYEPLALLDPEEAAAIRTSEGSVLTVFDADEEPRLNVRVVAVFETTWGDPDPRLVAGEGYPEDPAGWRRAAREVLQQALDEQGLELSDDLHLLVQTVEVVEVAPD